VTPTRAALHRLIGVDTRIVCAIAELAVGARDGARDLADLGITDIAEIIARLEAHLVTIRARTQAIFPEVYPQQP
jgi:hypothetical protein